MPPYKIAIIGPESSGKSTLGESLENHFKGKLINEYAREYLDNLGRKYEYEDLRSIAEGQLMLEERAQQHKPDYFFYDSNLLTIKIWSLDKFGKCDPWISERAEKQRYDLTLLCSPDIEWTPDPQREDPKRRDEIFRLYIYELEQLNIEYKIVQGQGDERLQNAIKYVSNL